MSGLGGVTRLCNLYERIPEQIHGLNAELEQAKKQLTNAKEQYGKPFQYEEQAHTKMIPGVGMSYRYVHLHHFHPNKKKEC